MFISAYGLVSSFYNKTLGEIYEDKDLSKKVKSIMNLIKLLADKEKVHLPLNIVEESYNKAKAFPYETKTSFQRDYENDLKKDERDTFAKTLIELSNRYNADCKCVRDIYENLKVKTL